MKSIKFSASVLIIFTCFLSYNGYCQTERGTLLLGGSIGLTSANSERVGFGDHDVFSFNFNPNISYAIIHRLIVGAIIPIEYDKISSSSQESKTIQYSIGPSIRYYIPFGNLAVFPEISYTVGKSKSDQPSLDPTTGQIANQTTLGDLTNFKCGVGITYFLNRSVGLEGILSYNKRNGEYDATSVPDYNYTSITFNIGFQIYFQAQSQD